MSLNAYRRTSALVESPRAAERRLILDVTAALIGARDAGLRGAALMDSLHWNREMWNAFAAACGAPGNALPDATRAAIVSLGLWVDRHTSLVMTGREPIDDLIEANTALLEGLSPALAAA